MELIIQFVSFLLVLHNKTLVEFTFIIVDKFDESEEWLISQVLAQNCHDHHYCDIMELKFNKHAHIAFYACLELSQQKAC